MIELNFTAMDLIIDEESFFKNPSSKRAYSKFLKGISITEYKNNEIIFQKDWELTIPMETKTQVRNIPSPPYLYNCWKEIEPHILNKTAIIYNANFKITHLVETYRYIKGKRIEKNKIEGDYIIGENESPDLNTVAAYPNAFSDCSKLSFDFLDLFGITNKIFIRNTVPTLKNIKTLCEKCGISSGQTNSYYVGELFIRIAKLLGTDNIYDIKHAAAITLGEVRKNIEYRVTLKQFTEISEGSIFKQLEDMSGSQVLEYDQMFRPCISIDDNYDKFRRYDFNALKDCGAAETVTSISEKSKSIISFPKNFVVIDIETTGRSYATSEIIEVAAIKVFNNKIIEKFSSFVKPKRKIPTNIVELTGITNEMIENAPDIDTILPEYLDFIGSDIIMGYSVGFDINFLNIYMQTPIKNNYINLLRFANKIISKNDVENHKLSTIAAYYSIDAAGNHRSLKDCEITYECYLRLCEDIDKKYNSRDEFINSFTEWNTEVQKKTFRREYIKISDLVPNTKQIDQNNSFFGKKCVFTGDLKAMSRKEAMQLVCDLGGECQNGVTKKTNYVIVGNFDGISNVSGAKSSKLIKAEEYIASGQDIKIISEKDFLEMIEDGKKYFVKKQKLSQKGEFYIKERRLKKL